MKKCDLFPVLDNQSKQLKQLAGLSNLISSAGGLSNTSQSDICACLSILSDIANNTLSQNDVITHEVTQLTIVSNSVAGLG